MPLNILHSSLPVTTICQGLEVPRENYDYPYRALRVSMRAKEELLSFSKTRMNKSPFVCLFKTSTKVHRTVGESVCLTLGCNMQPRGLEELL